MHNLLIATKPLRHKELATEHLRHKVTEYLRHKHTEKSEKKKLEVCSLWFIVRPLIRICIIPNFRTKVKGKLEDRRQKPQDRRNETKKQAAGKLSLTSSAVLGVEK